MDQSIETVILGVIANGMSVLIAHLSQKVGTKLIGKELLNKMKHEKTALQPILKKAADALAESVEWKGTPREEIVCLFLTSPECEAIVRQIYSAILSGDKVKTLDLIKSEFLASFSLYTGLPGDKLKDFATLLFNALMEVSEHALQIAIDEGILSAHEAKSTLRYRLVRDELEVIKKNVAFLTSEHKPNVTAILEFEEKYRQQVASRHAHITPPHFDVARKIPIDDIYVPSNFATCPKKKGEEQTELKMAEFLSIIYRAVLLGNPGGGKSTFVLKLCHDLSTYYKHRLFAGRQVLPILVILRDYGTEKKAHKCSILQFIESMVNTKYQTQPPLGAFEYLLLNGRAVVIFDGLDELLDTSYRQEISADIESFCNLYPTVPVLVTSREVGYEQAPLDEKRFEVFQLSNFNDDQVTEYVAKWFAADEDLTSDEQRQKVKAFLNESKIVPDLRSNPLMLALLCNIYRGENYIPKNRPDVYEKCASMLFERWDKSRGIFVPLPFEAHISPATKYLAHWIYSKEELQGGVIEERLVEKASEYLHPRRFEDRDEAERAAREFIDFCKGRAWVFTDTGTTKEGKKLYQFTHRTFLEHFTASHLVRTNPTPEDLKVILLPKIAKREWDVVAQLAFQLQNKQIEGAGDELLNALINQAREDKSEAGWNLLSFAARCLEFIVPSPRVTRDITIACIGRCLTAVKPIGKRESIEFLGDLLNATSENRATVANSLEKFLIEKIYSGTEEESLGALEIGLHLTLPLSPRHAPSSEVLGFWKDVSNHISETCSEKIKTLCPKHYRICHDAFHQGKVSFRGLIKWHGIEPVFRTYSFRMFPFVFSQPLAYTLLYATLSAPYLSEEEKNLYCHHLWSSLKEVGESLLLSPVPWIRKTKKEEEPFQLQFHIERISPRFRDVSPKVLLNLDSGILFGAFALFATILELQMGEKSSLIGEIKGYQIPFFNFMRWILIARFEQVDTQKVQAEMEGCGFESEQQDFIWRWIRREFDLVQSK